MDTTSLESNLLFCCDVQSLEVLQANKPTPGHMSQRNPVHAPEEKSAEVLTEGGRVYIIKRLERTQMSSVLNGYTNCGIFTQRDVVQR